MEWVVAVVGEESPASQFEARTGSISEDWCLKVEIGLADDDACEVKSSAWSIGVEWTFHSEAEARLAT